MKKTLIAALSGSLLFLSVGMPMAANAQDLMMYRPTTAAGGAPVDPSFWNNQANFRMGGSGGQTNVTIAPTVSSTTYYDYSTRPTTIEGGQTNVTAQADMKNGGTFLVTTQRGDIASQSSTTTNASTIADMGDGSTVATNTSSNTNNGD